jgi:small-conductance mechanosensitive channel
MSSISGLTSGISASRPLPEAQDKDESTDSSAKASTLLVPFEGVKVSLSGAGLSKAASTKSSNSDIDDSDLPDNIKSTLKLIRALQKQLADKMAELQAVMADRRLSPEDMRAKVNGLQAEISGLNAGLLTANTGLAKAMKQMGLSPDQVMKVSSLLMKSA